jgi:hypothetical protein
MKNGVSGKVTGAGTVLGYFTQNETSRAVRLNPLGMLLQFWVEGFLMVPKSEAVVFAVGAERARAG